MPAATPVTIPELDPMVAIPVDAEVHVPPNTVLPNAEVAPTQAFSVPVIRPGAIFTVTGIGIEQPVGSV